MRQGWEYCSVYEKNVTYYTAGGIVQRQTKKPWEAVGPLGEEDWELAAATMSGAMYFKRPLP